MNIVSKAFTYIFEEEGWKKKALILAAILIPACIIAVIDDRKLAHMNTNLIIKLALPIFILILRWISEGYSCKCTQNRIDEEKIVIPEWRKNIWEFIKAGFLLDVAAGAFVFTYLAFASLFITNIYKINVIISIILASLGIAIPLAFAFFYTAMRSSFCTDLRITSFYSIEKIKYIMQNNFINYLKVIGLIFGLNVLVIIMFIGLKRMPILLPLGLMAQTYLLLTASYLRGTLFTIEAEEKIHIETQD